MYPKKTIIQRHPLTQTHLLQNVYAHLSIVEMCRCACVSKVWNDATKLPKFHPSKEVEIYMNQDVDPRIYGLHVDTNKPVMLLDVPPSRFPDIACVVRKIDFVNETFPEHIQDPKIYHRLKELKFCEEPPYPTFLQALVDKVDIVEFEGIGDESNAGYTTISSNLNFSNIKLVETWNTSGDIMEFQFPKLIALSFYFGIGFSPRRIPNTVRVVKIGDVCRRTNEDELAKMTNEMMKKVEVLIVEVEELSDYMIPLMKAKFEEFVNLQKFILLADRHYDIAPRGIDFEQKGYGDMENEELLKFALAYFE